MFKEFLEKFELDQNKESESSEAFNFGERAIDLNECFQKFSGMSFNNGLYHFHSAHSIEKWNVIVGEAFPQFSERIFCFSYDWLGRNFSLDRSRIDNGEPQILMLEPGTGEALEIPVTFLKFHNDELVNFANAALAKDFYESWLRVRHKAPGSYECVGFKTPLFLGGDDEVENLEVMDMEVYWAICGQLLSKTRNMPPGTPVDDINIE